MGGLRKQIPWTFWTMTAATFAIAGIPPFAGFFSKDEILWTAFSSEHGSWIFWAVGLITAFLTSFYMFRLWFLTFFGEFRGAEAERRASHAQLTATATSTRAPRVMLVPLVILGGAVGDWRLDRLAADDRRNAALRPLSRAGVQHSAPRRRQSPLPQHGKELLLAGVSVLAALLGLFLAWLLYQRRRDLPDKIAASLNGLYTAVRDKYYVDEGYATAFVQPLIKGSTYILWRGIDAGRDRRYGKRVGGRRATRLRRPSSYAIRQRTLVRGMGRRSALPR